MLQKPIFIPHVPLNTPVLFLIYNRPNITKKVFSEIQKAKPKRLYVAADGPPFGNMEENKLCIDARSILNDIDWECDIKTLIRDENLGCKKAVSEAINWFFENESEGIILEDDLLPSQSFFWYCQELLDYYRDDNRIMHIGGSNFQFGRNRSPYDYYFSRYAHVWGWATWKKSWQHYKDIDYWSSKKLKELFNSLGSNRDFVKYWNNEMQKVKSGKIDTWDYQWTFTCWEKNGLSILPDINLVSNIGFGKNATHTKKFNPVSNIPNQEIRFPLHHPIKITRSKKRDSFTEFGQFFKPFFLRLIYKIFRTDRIKINIF